MNYQTENGGPKSRSGEVAWCLLAEYSLSEFRVDGGIEDGLRAGSLFQTIRDLGVPPEFFKKMKGTLAGFVEVAMAYFDRGKIEIQLTGMFGLEVASFQFNDDVTAELQMVKQEVEVKILAAHFQ